MTESGLPPKGLAPRRTTADGIADVLREAILTGQFKDGDELNQVHLAQHYGVSRVPLREALQRLQAEGLVVSRAHQRAVVSGLTLDRVLEVIDIRLLLEAYLLERAVEAITDERIARLRAICAEMEKVDDHNEWLHRNREFHDLIYSSADAPVALELTGQMAGRVERYLHMWSDSGVQRKEEAANEHRRIVDALAARDKRRARLELELHIMHTREQITTLFNARGPGSDKEEENAAEAEDPGSAGRNGRQKRQRLSK
ncbi:GntR family transcriptional regulator [Streptomyces puniciscabiei]